MTASFSGKISKLRGFTFGICRFFTLGEDEDRLERSIQGERSLEALARFGGKALDDASLSVYRQLRQLLVREALACTLRKSVSPQSASEHLAHRG